jgi:hypothetical protein
MDTYIGVSKAIALIIQLLFLRLMRKYKISVNGIFLHFETIFYDLKANFANLIRHLFLPCKFKANGRNKRFDGS